MREEQCGGGRGDSYDLDADRAVATRASVVVRLAVVMRCRETSVKESAACRPATCVKLAARYSPVWTGLGSEYDK